LTVPDTGTNGFAQISPDWTQQSIKADRVAQSLLSAIGFAHTPDPKSLAVSGWPSDSQPFDARSLRCVVPPSSNQKLLFSGITRR
jgi:hypothetical protein